MRGARGMAMRLALLLGVLLVLLQYVDSLSCEEILGKTALSQSILNNIDNDLQIAVDCFANGTKPLLLEPRLVIFPNASIILRQPITIKSQAFEESRPTLACPPDGGAVFEIRSSGVRLENLRVSGCSTRSPTSSAVLIDVPERRHSRRPGVQPPDATLESMSFIANENSKGPGAIYVRSATELSFRRVHFDRNKGVDGGALQVHSPGVTVEFMECNFEENRASGSGGAISSNAPADISIANSLLNSNIAALDGGAIFVKEGKTTLNTSQTNFELNMALDGSGGAMKFEGADIVVLITDSNLTSCEASSTGGAISITAANSAIEIVGVSFKGNRGTDGGALHAKSASQKLKATCKKVHFEGNLAHSSQMEEYNTKGGAIFLEGVGVHFSIAGWELNTFSKNIAHEGGAIRIIDTGPVEIANSYFLENVAMSGGGVHGSFTDKSTERTLTIQGTAFEKNVAYMGGGIMADAKIAGQSFIPDDGLATSLFHVSLGLTEPQLIMRTVYMFDHEVVKDGGALLLSDIVATCEDCLFAGNRVDEHYLGAGGAVALFRFASFDITLGWFEDNQAVSGGGVFVGNSLLTGRNLTFEGNVAFDKGGGVAVESTRQLVFQMGDVLVDMKDSIITNNRAKIGGGIHSDILVGPEFEGCVRASVGVQSWSIYDDGIDSILADVARACSVSGQIEIKKLGLALRLIDTMITGNSASQAGGGIFINDPQTTCLCCNGMCSESCPSAVDAEKKTLVEACSKSWKGNTVGEGGYGPSFATIGFSAGVTFTHGVESLGVWNETLLSGHTSGFPLPPFTVKIVDSFDQVVTAKPPQEGVVRVNSKAGVLSGQVDKVIQEGIAQFNATILSGRPSYYELFLTFPGNPTLGVVNLGVNVRECVRGEHANIGKYSTDFRCFSCPNDTYSFDPNADCELCPGNARCNGLTIAPNDGYWHFDSWSGKIEKCLSPVACAYTGRQKRLQTDSESADGPLRHDQNYGLCREGYQGILCGSCQDGYGRGRGFECTKCFTRGKSIVLLAVGLVWAMAVISVVVKGALKAGEPVGAPFNHEPFNTYNNSTGSGGCVATEEPKEIAKEGPSRMLESTRRLNSECGENIGAISRRRTVVCLGVNAATENAKILINFFQVTSIALAINVNWRTEARKALEALGARFERLCEVFDNWEHLLFCF
ncbi:hypothetical protein BSKO_12045 [Bryopsis sp. KO-2023]|nr:hypothetical protein BSKO_12045 [Bryopsis sp. KO-2023]